MDKSIHGSELRILDEQELDAVVGGSLYDGFRALGKVIELTAVIGAGCIVVPANVVMQTAAK